MQFYTQADGLCFIIKQEECCWSKTIGARVLLVAIFTIVQIGTFVINRGQVAKLAQVNVARIGTVQ